MKDCMNVIPMVIFFVKCKRGEKKRGKKRGEMTISN